jgi:hypothetical protein
MPRRVDRFGGAAQHDAAEIIALKCDIFRDCRANGPFA